MICRYFANIEAQRTTQFAPMKASSKKQSVPFLLRQSCHRLVSFSARTTAELRGRRMILNDKPFSADRKLSLRRYALEAHIKSHLLLISFPSSGPRGYQARLLVIHHLRRVRHLIDCTIKLALCCFSPLALSLSTAYDVDQRIRQIQ